MNLLFLFLLLGVNRFFSGTRQQFLYYKFVCVILDRSKKSHMLRMSTLPLEGRGSASRPVHDSYPPPPAAVAANSTVVAIAIACDCDCDCDLLSDAGACQEVHQDITPTQCTFADRLKTRQVTCKCLYDALS